MSYKALYRTYRPLSFSEVAGQQAIVKTLQNALKQNKIAHAYLFSGPRGTGKTSMAKLFAKALNCEEGVGKQCNKCSNCLGVNDGSHPDVYEIDAASNNGVDDVRQLIDNVNYAPIKGQYKVYIIDEVHMMSQSAFNALLKTLEEPPAHVIFILATTEAHKVIPTILSRCQRYNFSKVSENDIKNRLIKILNSEDLPYEEEALSLLVSLADGGVRDALSMLDQVLAYSGKSLRTDDVLELFALTSKIEQLNLLKAISDQDLEKVFTITNTFMDKGVDVKRLTLDLLTLLKDGLLYFKTKEHSLLVSLRESEAAFLTNTFSISEINTLIDLLLKAQSEYRFATNTQNIFEITLLKMLTSLEPVSEKQSPAPKEVKVARPAPTPVAPTPQPAIVPQPETELPPFMKETTPSPVAEITISPQPSAPVSKPSAPMPSAAPVVEIAAPATEPSIKIVKKPVSTNHLVKEGTPIALPDLTIIKAMTLGDRDERKKLKDVLWDNELPLLAMDSEISEHASLLLEGTPYILANEILILEFNFPRSIKECNTKENQPLIQEVMHRLVGRKLPVYGVSSDEILRLNKMYRNLNQIQQLPRVKNIISELEGVF